MTVYLVGHIDITDRDRYADYEAGFMDVFAKYNGEFVAVDDTPESLEGEADYTRCVIIRFPDADSAHAWYDSEGYQQLAAIRWEASASRITLIEGRE